MSITISEKAQALLLMQTCLDEANTAVQKELQGHYDQLGKLRQAIIDRDAVEFTMGKLIKAIAGRP